MGEARMKTVRAGLQFFTWSYKSNGDISEERVYNRLENKAYEKS